MKRKSKYLRTDMAEECYDRESIDEIGHGIRFSEEKAGEVVISRLEIIDEKGEEIIGKPIGSYITIGVGKIWQSDGETFKRISHIISAELKCLADKLSPSLDSLLVVGLGNRYITSDAIGPLAIKDLTVTRHIKELEPKLFETLSSLSVSAIAPGVIGQTGIEAVEIIRGAANNVSPSLIIVIDALAAKSIDRLAVTVQLSDTGLAPGSGIGNTRKAIDRENLGIPVISIGVPTVVDSSTLIYDMLEKAGAEELSDDIKSILDNGKSFFVTLKDSDLATREAARLIAHAINHAFSVEL